MQVEPANISLRIGETKAASASVSADPGVSTAVTWSSDNSAVAVVNATGVITAVGPGTTRIKASADADSRLQGSANVAVAPIRGIVVAPAAATLSPGNSQSFSATVSLPDGQSTAVTWSTSNATVATVDGQGKVTATGIGAATITATSVSDPSLKATASVAVSPAVRSLSISPASAQIYLGETKALSVTADADEGASLAVTWQSSNTSVAAVSGTGIVTAVATGSATITATSVANPAKKATASVVVASRPVSVSITQGNQTLIPGATFQLEATVSGDPGIPTGVVWSTSAASVATVSGTGLVTAIGNGGATITASAVADPTRKANVTITVGTRLASAWTAARLGGPLYEDILSMYVAGTNDVFAVNLPGDVFRYNGTTWTKVLSGSANGTSFKAVHGTSASNVFAVGSNGKVYRWQGSTWTPMTTGTNQTLNAVYSVSANLVYAAGNAGTIVRFDGTAWTSVSSGTTEDLRSVWGQATSAVAVGDNGETVYYNGFGWNRIPSGTTEHLHAVAGYSSANIMAVGDFGTIIRFDGMQWESVQSGSNADLMTIAISGADNRTYISGSFGTVLQVSGETVVPLETPYAARFMSSGVDAAGNVWAAGQRGIVQRLSDGEWSVKNLAPDLLDVWSTSANNSWAVGEFGFVYRWNGVTWSRQDAPTRERLNTVWAADANNAFAGGDFGVLLRWNGSTWVQMSFPSENDVLAIWGTGADNVFAVTFGGEVVRFNGASWQIVQVQSRALYGVSGSGANDVYAIGDQGVVLRFNGSQWSTDNVGASALLVGLWASGPTNAVSVGLSPADPTLGAAYRYNGASWTSANLQTTPPELTSIFGVNAFDLYATGGAGTILRYNGTSWQNMSAGTTDYLWAVSGAPNGSGGAFAVGYNSTVVVGSNGAASIIAADSRAVQQRTFNPSPRSRVSRTPLRDGQARSPLSRTKSSRVRR